MGFEGELEFSADLEVIDSWGGPDGGTVELVAQNYIGGPVMAPGTHWEPTLGAWIGMVAIAILMGFASGAMLRVVVETARINNQPVERARIEEAGGGGGLELTMESHLLEGR